MARHAEEEENHWPGFVDALSTIVMVVTFLLIILGVAIFAISTQVSKAIKQSQAEAQALTQASAEMTAAIEQKSQEAKQAEQKAAEAASALSKAIADKATAEAAEKAAEAQMIPVPAPTVEDKAVDAALQQAQQTIADQAKELEKQKQAAAQLLQQVATLNQAAPKAPTQDEAVEADNKLLIDSRKPIDPAQINIAAEEETTRVKAVEVKSAAEVLTVHFESGAVKLGDEGEAKAVAFAKANAATLAGKKISLWSFYDSTTLGLTQAKRSAYFRVLALRNAMIDAGLETQNIDVSVRPAESPGDVDTVKAFVQ